MAIGGKTIEKGTRVLALTLAVLLAVFLTQVATHTHENGQSETTCQICQAVHLGTILPSAALSVHIFCPQPEGDVVPFVVAYHNELFVHDSPSRAPPSFSL